MDDMLRRQRRAPSMPARNRTERGKYPLSGVKVRMVGREVIVGVGEGEQKYKNKKIRRMVFSWLIF
jgi:hypothetical protein